ncbi:nucleotide sugar dehydrogenase [bacterium]|nr:nucleotide sugar dehydrogenase [bacterium]
MDSFIKVSDDSILIDIDKKKPRNQTLNFDEFKQKIENRNISVGVIGLGYSGLPLAVSFAELNFAVTGIEFDSSRVKMLNSGKSYIENVASTQIKNLINSDKFYAVSDLKVLPELDVIIICDQVPIGIPKNKDVSFVMALVENIVSALSKTQLIIFETVTPPGALESVIFPLFEDQNLVVNKDFFLAISPYRGEPGNTSVQFSLIPRIVAGITKESKDLANCLMKTIFKQTIELSSARTAEMTKFLEQSHAWVNQALINQFAIISHGLGINIWEVIKAASSNPFEYIRHLPCPGQGTVSRYDDEAFALSWKKSFEGFEVDIIDNAIQINTTCMRKFVINKITDMLNAQKKCINDAKILIVGVAAKRNISDWHESPCVEIIKELIDKKANVYYHDPHVSQLPLDKMGFSLSSIKLETEMLKWVDLTVIMMDHKEIDFEKIVNESPLVLDTKNATHKCKGQKTNVSIL